MKIVMERKQFLQALQRVQGVAERRSTMPILSNVLLETVKDGITVTATDLEIGLRGTYPATIHDEGKITLSAKKLYEVVREVPDGDVTLQTEENHWTVIKAGKSHFKMRGLSPDDFPSIPEFEEKKLVSLDPSIFSMLIRRTIAAVSEGDTRQILNGVLLETVLDGKQTKLRLVGTDGHRLALAESPIQEAFWGSGETPRQIVIPKKAVMEVRRLLDEGVSDLAVGLTQNLIGFRMGGVFLFSRLLEGTFPNYQQVVPPEGDHTIGIQRPEFEGMLKRVALFSREKTHAVTLEVTKGKVSLASNDPEVGEAREEMAAAYEGGKITVGFNARYLLEAIGSMDADMVFLEIANALSPCLIRQKEGREFLCVIMPLRIQET